MKSGETIRRRSPGFSLVEILVVVLITGLLTTLVLINYRSGQQMYALNAAAQTLAADIHRAQNLALSGTVQGADNPIGYGIYTLAAGQYILFYNSGSSPPPFADRYKKSGSTGSVTLETISLTNGVTFNAGSVDKSVFFSPPDPTTSINGNPSGSQVFTLTNSGGKTKTVTVDASGRVDIQ